MHQMGVAESAEKEREVRGSVSDLSKDKKPSQEPSKQSDLVAVINAIKSKGKL